MESEARALPGLAFYCNIALMGLDDPARDSKPPPRAARAVLTGPRGIAAVETLEDVRQVLRADALARIADGHFHARADSPRMDFDRPSGRRVLQCIADEIIEHPSDGLSVHKD